MSLNKALGIPDTRAKEISKKYAKLIKPIFEKGELTEHLAIEIIQEMGLTDQEKAWFLYHVGGVNRLILYANENAKQIVINW